MAAEHGRNAKFNAGGIVLPRYTHRMNEDGSYSWADGSGKQPYRASGTSHQDHMHFSIEGDPGVPVEGLEMDTVITDEHEGGALRTTSLFPNSNHLDEVRWRLDLAWLARELHAGTRIMSDLNWWLWSREFEDHHYPWLVKVCGGEEVKTIDPHKHCVEAKTQCAPDKLGRIRYIKWELRAVSLLSRYDHLSLWLVDSDGVEPGDEGPVPWTDAHCAVLHAPPANLMIVTYTTHHKPMTPPQWPHSLVLGGEPRSEAEVLEAFEKLLKDSKRKKRKMRKVASDIADGAFSSGHMSGYVSTVDPTKPGDTLTHGAGRWASTTSDPIEDMREMVESIKANAASFGASMEWAEEAMKKFSASLPTPLTDELEANVKAELEKKNQEDGVSWWHRYLGPKND